MRLQVFKRNPRTFFKVSSRIYSLGWIIQAAFLGGCAAPAVNVVNAVLSLKRSWSGECRWATSAPFSGGCLDQYYCNCGLSWTVGRFWKVEHYIKILQQWLNDWKSLSWCWCLWDFIFSASAFLCGAPSIQEYLLRTFYSLTGVMETFPAQRDDCIFLGLSNVCT